ncbi:keratinocyte proline-rich protein-like [Chiloscyllium plagiosum]|uniref:keratinocyte proline-rich protein-like n=1 Tax=Chiloscyllium plagiosum TaxID=36176 RepID=UPI001CB7BE37|nr:keratinocyte proline-rich protein-like [Chiloscyllium plagiosum]
METDYPGELGMPLRTPEEMEPYDYYAQSHHERRGMLDMSIESELMDLDLDIRELRAYDARVHCQEFSVEPPVEEVWSVNDVDEHASGDSGTPHKCPAETTRSGRQCQGPGLYATDLRAPGRISETEEARDVDCSTAACAGGGEHPCESSSGSGKAGCSTLACCAEQTEPGAGSTESGKAGCSTLACCAEQTDPGAGGAGCSAEGTLTGQDETDGEASRPPALTPSPASLAPSPGRIYHARSLPVVPPKPHYAKLPLVLKGKRRTDNPAHPEVTPRPPSADHAHCGPEPRPAITVPAHPEGRHRPPLADHAHSDPEPRPAMTVSAHPEIRPRPPSTDHAHYCSEPHPEGRHRPPLADHAHSESKPRPATTVPAHPEVSPHPPQADHAHSAPEPRPAPAGPAPSDDTPRPRCAGTDTPEDRPRPRAPGHSPAAEGPRPHTPEAPLSEPRAARAHAWRTAASLSFDEAVALARRQRGAGRRPGGLQRGDSAPDAPRGAHERLTVPPLASERAGGGAARCRSLVLEAEEAP